MPKTKNSIPITNDATIIIAITFLHMNLQKIFVSLHHKNIKCERGSIKKSCLVGQDFIY